MSGREIEIGLDARERILAGALKLSKTVASTYGPCGRTVVLDRPMGLLTTKDGVTVAREINLEDPFENQGVQLLKGACVKVNDEVIFTSYAGSEVKIQADEYLIMDESDILGVIE